MRFVSIARHAQEELTNVRVGAIQDAFAPLAAQLISEPDVLRGYMQDIQRLNPTITNFFIVSPSASGWTIVVSSDKRTEASAFLGNDFLLNLATSDTSHSYTIQETEGRDRYFRTARAVLNASSSVIGVAITRQGLSEADREIAASIQTAMVLLVAILCVLMLLFFRHARIVDYMSLYRKLKEVDQLKDDFISMASHELRTPLTAIRGYADLLKQNDNMAPAEKTQALDRIDISAVALDRLIGDMLDVSRIEQGRMKFDLKEIDPSPVIRSVMELLSPVAKTKQLALSASLSEGLLIAADEDRLRQIAVNLIGNAVKYTPQGSVKVETSAENGIWSMRVSDTGLGMSSSVRDHLFEKFYRAPGKDVRSQTGTGLGLWITKQLIEKMSGTIEVESIEGVGSHFIVSFPISEKKTVEA
jgi:signal transduction histidine kinase